MVHLSKELLMVRSIFRLYLLLKCRCFILKCESFTLTCVSDLDLEFLLIVKPDIYLTLYSLTLNET